LDEEALRLIRQAKLLPGMTDKKIPVRSKFVIVVDFPPK
jgi:outer membrane biosynthesis protein TonB